MWKGTLARAPFLLAHSYFWLAHSQREASETQEYKGALYSDETRTGRMRERNTVFSLRFLRTVRVLWTCGIDLMSTMSWEPGRDRPDNMEIDDVVTKLLQNFDYEAIVPQPAKYALLLLLWKTMILYKRKCRKLCVFAIKFMYGFFFKINFK